jgi:hypothetical protein
VNSVDGSSSVLHRTVRLSLYASAADYTAVMTSARRLVMDCVSLRDERDCCVEFLFSSFFVCVCFPRPLFSIRLDESDQQRQSYTHKKRMSVMTFFFFPFVFVCVCAIVPWIPFLLSASLLYSWNFDNFQRDFLLLCQHVFISRGGSRSVCIT